MNTHAFLVAALLAAGCICSVSVRAEPSSSNSFKSYIQKFAKKDVLLVEPASTFVGRLTIVGDDYACVDKPHTGDAGAGEHCFGLGSISRTEISKDGALVIHLNR